MQKKNYKGKCEKIALSKSKEVCRLYSPIQISYINTLQLNKDILEIKCNVLMENLSNINNDITGEYTSDFVCIKTDGETMVRECVYSNHLTKPMTARLLDASYRYWSSKGIKDWGIVIDVEN